MHTTHVVGHEHPCAARLRTLLALAASAIKVGSIGEAAAAGKAARKIADEAGLRRGYIDHFAGCEFINERMVETSRIESWVHPSPSATWQACKEYASNSFGRTAEPSEYVISGAISTGELNKHGALVMLVDWSDVHQAADFAAKAISA